MTELTTERLLITQLPQEAADRMVAYFEQNRDHLEPWEPARPEGFHTEEYWRRQLAQQREDHARDVAVRFTLLRRDAPGGPIVGQCNFTQIFRGPLQACMLGFSLARAATGQGLMTEALRTAIPFMFNTVGLHRIQAGYRPTNERSGRLLRRLGFAVEGYARDYLFIAGEWRDHVLTALTNPSPRPPA